MKLPFKLYEEAGDGGAGVGGDAGGNAGGNGSLLSSAGGQGAGGSGGGTGGSSAGSGTSGGGGAGTGGGAAGTEGGAGNNAGTGQDPFYVGLWDKSGKINKAAFDKLPDGLKAYKDTFAKYDTAEAFFHGVGNLVNLAGKKGLQPLPADAPEAVKAERAALMRTLNNVPEKIEGYGVKKPDGLPDDQWNPEYVNGILGVLHKHNASPELVKELVALDAQSATAMRAQGEAAKQAAYKQEVATLQKEFGAEFGKKIDLAARAARTLGLDPNDASVFGNAKVVSAFARMAEMVSEDRLVNGDASAGFSKGDREKALDIINNAANPLHTAYHNTADPRHKQAVDQVTAFNKAAMARKKAS